MEKIGENVKIKKIAITGGIGAGKSLVCDILKKLGSYVIKADELIHRLLSPQTSTGRKVILLLGKSIMNNSSIDRKKVAEIVFSDAQKLKKLENILHPELFKNIKQTYEKVKNNKAYTLFVVEIPLVFETKQETFFDFILCVTAPEKACIKRFEKVGFSEEEYEKRMQHQLSTSNKAKRADFVIENNASLKQLEKKVKKIHEELI